MDSTTLSCDVNAYSSAPIEDHVGPGGGMNLSRMWGILLGCILREAHCYTVEEGGVEWVCSGGGTCSFNNESQKDNAILLQSLCVAQSITNLYEG